MRLPRVLRRTQALVPERAWPVLLSVRSAFGEGPLIADPNLRRVLVLAPHPDDESLGCAGTIALLTERGARVTVAFATDGEATIGSAASPEDTGRARRAEAVAACAVLGVTDTRFWSLADGTLGTQLGRAIERLAELLEDVGPDGVFLPWFLDGHPDHQAMGAAMAAVRPGDDVELWGYETWTPLPANRLVDVTSTFARKEAAIAAHHTAAQAFDLRAALGINRWRTLHGMRGRGHAEGFLVAPAGAWLALRARALEAAE